MTSYPGVILAGGQAKRMGGGDKCLLALDNQSILQHVVNRIGPQVTDLAINANGDGARFSEFGLPIISDPIQGFAGPLAGVLSAMVWAADQGAGHVVTVAADTPFFPQNLVQNMGAAITKETPICLAATRDPVRGNLRQPTFGLWPVDLAEDLKAALQNGVRKVVLWTDRHRAALAVYDEGRFDPFFNINTVTDLDKAKEILAKGVQ